MSLIQINTTQNVNIDFELASFGERIFATIIDLIVISLYIYLSLNILESLGVYEYNMDFWSYRALQSLVLLPAWVYTLVLETLLHGQTLGKKVMQIKVVKIDGYAASFLDYFSRWMLRLVDIWIAFSLVGFISILSTKNSQRVGGLASGTGVISLKNKYNIDATILEDLDQNYKATYPSVINLTDRDMQIIKNIFLTAQKSKDQKMLLKLRVRVEELTKTSKEKKSDAEYLKIIMKDYTHFTQNM